MLSLWKNSSLENKMLNRNYFDTFFDDTFNLGIESKKDKDGSLLVTMDVPGIKADDINIEITNRVLTVKGEKKTATSQYQLCKSFTLPEGYSEDNILAELTNGVLTLRLTLKEPVLSKTKKVPILTK